jgi:hypothetical protein
MNVYRRLTPIIVLLLLTVLFVSVITIRSTTDGPIWSSLEGGALKFKGMDYAAWWWTTPPESFSSVDAELSLNAVKNEGVNWVGVNVFWSQPLNTSTTISADPTYTQSDAAVIDAINEIHARGMKVMLKPLDAIKSGELFYRPSDPAAWFDSYAAFINHYAQIAQDHGVELFSIGCELNAIDTSAYQSNWTTIISGVRAIYSGQLTYSANWWGQEYSQVPFWGLLDYAGVDAYFPLSDAQTPTVSDCVAGWSHYVYYGSAHNWLHEIETWQAAINKPVIFTEIGYRSVDYAASVSPHGSYNAQAQVNCYTAALKVFANKAWFAGMFWWVWEPNTTAAGPGNTDYTLNNKPAQNVLIAHWLPDSV